VIEQYGSLPEIRNGLFDRALYQVVRSAVETTNMTLATDALGKILTWYPESYFGDRSLLMVGQALNRQGKPAEARLVFVNFLKRFPNSPLAPEVHLAIARTYVQERDWPAAIGKFDDWVQNNRGSAALPRAEYDRAWVYFQAGQQLGNPSYQSNAVTIFTNIVAKFPTDEVAVRAQSWVADYYANVGDHINAEKNYQLLYQNTNWPATYLPLRYAARINAGRSALARQNYKEAQEYFKALINDEQAPAEFVALAWFALGDAIIEEPIADRAKALDKFATAINAFDTIVRKFPNDPLVPRALGKIGNCHLQLGAVDAKRYDQATEAYRKAWEHPLADVATRSQAEIGLALVLQRQAALRTNGDQAALLGQSVDHCLNVLYGKNLRDGETADTFWLKESGLLAGSILEGLGRRDEAEKVYRRLMQEVPVLRGPMEKNLERLRQPVGSTAGR
jgi:TolA-binding protein